jgi:hypothetical protein
MVSLLAVAVGAVIALAATLIAETIRTRREHALVISRLRYDACLDFVLAFVCANEALRAIGADGRDRAAEVAAAMSDSGLYAARERLLVTGSRQMVFAGEATFRALLELRDAVARGQSVAWPDFQPASDELARAVWSLRQVARRELNGLPLDLGELDALQTPEIAGRLRPDPRPGPEPGQAPPRHTGRT